MYQKDLLEVIFGHEVSILGLDFRIYLYGLFIALGILGAVIVYYTYTTKKGMPVVVQDFCFFSSIIGILAGFFFADLFQAFYNYLESGVFELGHGITVMGGLAGGAVCFAICYFGAGHFYFKNKNKGLHVKEFNKMFTVIPPCVTLAHSLGRIGCLMGGCCHGAYLGQEKVVGGLWMDPGDGIAGYYVPTQLYESIFLLVLFVVLSYLYLKKDCNITQHIYLIGYGIWRFIIEFVRDDDRGKFFLGLAPSQWFSIVFILLGVGLIIFYKVKKIPFKIHYEPRQKTEKKAS